MKEFSKKSLAMLFAMFMLGACSVADNTDNSSSSAGDKAMDEALGELDVNTTGMTQWRFTASLEEDGISRTSTADYYFGADEYAIVTYCKITEGSYWYWRSIAGSGDLEIITDYTLTGSTGSEISDKDGYAVYAFTRKDSYYDYDTNHPDYVNEDGSVYVEYNLVKISGSTMYIIYGGSYDESSNTFALQGLYGEDVESLADAYGMTFEKQ